jgi:CTP-dependent riboflavin kinase
MQANQNESYITVKIKGTVMSGGGESSKWMPTYIPWLYPGTLNLQLEEKKPSITYFQSIPTHYKEGTRSAYVGNCRINGVDAFIIFPPLAKNRKRRIELGATFNIRERFNLKDGDQIIVEFI